jgi:hypothetical protein
MSSMKLASVFKAGDLLQFMIPHSSASSIVMMMMIIIIVSDDDDSE